jgi:hypothetical protein
VISNLFLLSSKIAEKMGIALFKFEKRQAGKAWICFRRGFALNLFNKINVVGRIVFLVIPGFPARVLPYYGLGPNLFGHLRFSSRPRGSSAQEEHLEL